jgi:outer membrane protein TolC
MPTLRAGRFSCRHTLVAIARPFRIRGGGLAKPAGSQAFMFRTSFNSLVCRPSRRARGCIALWTIASLLVAGCGTPPREALQTIKFESKNYYQKIAAQVDYSDASLHAPNDDAEATPFSVTNNAPTSYWDMTLQEAIVLALSNSPVLRDLGGQLLRSPTTVPTIQTVGSVETDPRFGLENALSQFDAQYTTQIFYQKNDRALNNTFFGGGTRLLQQDYAVAQNTISKATTAGTQFFARNNTTYDSNNAPGNIFPSAWDTNFELEFRHPLLQGAGVEFNRIAGVNGQPGLFNGVVLARINTDISLADFEIAVRNMLADVENAYWDLYAAYRDLQSKVAARDGALEVWRRTHALFVAQRRGGEAEKEAYAREQYYHFQEEVENALAGILIDGTRTNNGSSGGTFRGAPGLHVAERRLRFMIGIPLTDGRMIRPADEPIVTKVVLDWPSTVQEAMARRPELRRQRWVVKRREMELIAAKNFLMPRLDVNGIYRFRGFGDTLLNAQTQPGRFDNAVQNLLNGDFQEWQLGANMTVPLGFRRGHNAVRNAQIVVARERVVLREQERAVALDLSNAAADLDRAYVANSITYNRLAAARDQLTAVQTTFEADKTPIDFLLESQRRFLDAEGRFHRTLVEYATALRNVHFEKGTSLEYHGVFLQEDASHLVRETPANRAIQSFSYAFARERQEPELTGAEQVLAAAEAAKQPSPAGPTNGSAVAPAGAIVPAATTPPTVVLPASVIPASAAPTPAQRSVTVPEAQLPNITPAAGRGITGQQTSYEPPYIETPPTRSGLTFPPP